MHICVKGCKQSTSLAPTRCQPIKGEYKLIHKCFILCILHICVYKIYNSLTLFKGKISYKVLAWSQSSLPLKELTIFIYFELINVFGIMWSCLLHNDFHSCLFLYSCMLQGSGDHVSCISMYRYVCNFLHVQLTICMQLFGTRYPCTRSTFANRMLSAEEP